jgi:site-specific DNA-methyltransferase (adenine-specific)
MNITNECNMELMSRYKDNYFDLAIVDPPYGLGDKTTNGGSLKNTSARWNNHKWDDAIPTDKYFKELKRVSKNQIIWGANYFSLCKYRCVLVWHKNIYVPTMSEIEIAYTSFDKPCKFVKLNCINKKRIHPTQKPVKLYEWLLMNYAKEGDKILDTHFGSGSIAIACHNLKYDLTACELDKEYYEAAMERIEKHKQQLTMF